MPPSNTQVYAGLSARALKSVPLSALAPLTLRQAEVLGWIAAGKRNREIAELLGRSVRTVEKHVENIMEALNGETRSGVAAWWHKRRWEIEHARARKGSRLSFPDDQPRP